MIKEAIRFYKMRSSWLGDGGQPVSSPHAQWRAEICAKCPKNQPRGIYEGLATIEANRLRRLISLKNEMNLHVEGEERLHVCDACACVLSLKAWVPIKHIANTTGLDSLPSNCWILEETGK